MPYISQENIALVTTSVFLKKHPEAVTDVLRVADKLRVIGDKGITTMDEIYNEITTLILKSDLKVKQELLVAVKSILNEYEWILNTDYIDTDTFKAVLNQLADGMEDAIQIAELIKDDNQTTQGK